MNEPGGRGELENVPIEEIELGIRHRRDLGDIESLAASIADVGLLQPIVLTHRGFLVAGERRLAAVRALGRAEVLAYVVDDLDDAATLLRAERDENTCRKAFTPTEEHALYEALLAIEKPKAEARQKKLGRSHGALPPADRLADGRSMDSQSAANSTRKTPSGKFPEGSHLRAKETAAEAATGQPGRYKTLDKVGEVKAIAGDENKPEPVRQLATDALTEMDATGRVDGAYQRVKHAERQADQHTEVPQPSAAVTEWLESDPKLQDARYVKDFHSELVHTARIPQFDAARLAGLLDEDDLLAAEQVVASLTRFFETIRGHRTGLRLVQGGKGGQP